MDVQEFLKELDGRGFSFGDKSYSEFGFNDEILNMVYEMYCAGQQAAHQRFEKFIDQAICDSACAEERQTLQRLLNEAQEQGHDL